jgi:hypothetical protein
MNKPYIIITIGPSGSGKTLLAQKTIEYLKLLDKDMSTSFTRILIDELVENNIAYKEKISSIVKECVDEYRQVNKSSKIKECFTCSKSNCYYLRPDVFEKLSKSYWYVREKPYCNESSHLSCAMLNDELLKQAVEKNENIVFEITGANTMPTWILSDPFISSEYNVIFSYSLLNIDELIMRNIIRFEKSLQNFAEDNANPAPRLPNIQYNHLEKHVYAVRNSLLKLYNKCILDYNIYTCNKHKINKLLIFDNNDHDIKLIFDSDINKYSLVEVAALVNRLLRLENKLIETNLLDL